MKSNLELPPIPYVYEPADSARLPILDNDEPLLPVPLTGRLRSRSLYFEMRIPEAMSTISVRSGVLDRLHQAVAALPTTVSLVVYDGYRPLAVQRWLWDTYLAMIAANEQHLAIEQVELKTRQYVAFPETDPLRPPPHRTGGAVDVYLVDSATGEEVPMGTSPDAAQAESVTRHYETVPEEPFRSNRRLLWHAMTNAGFANYPGEWWHFDYGNQYWANLTGAESAIYGLPGNGDVGL